MPLINIPTSAGREAAQDALVAVIGLGTSVPITGTHSLGEIVINTAPVLGEPFGWRCVVAGTPGTWEALFVEPNDFIPTMKSVYLPQEF